MLTVFPTPIAPMPIDFCKRRKNQGQIPIKNEQKNIYELGLESRSFEPAWENLGFVEQQDEVGIGDCGRDDDGGGGWVQEAVAMMRRG